MDPRRSALAPYALVVAFLAGVWAMAHTSGYYQGLFLVAAVFSMLALSLDLVAGMLGLFSLGHAGLFALGAYSTAILCTTHGWSVFAALPVAVVGVGLVGVVIGALSLRVSGLYFAITSFIFTLIVNVVVSDETITGGYAGMSGPLFPSFPRSASVLGTSLVWAIGVGLLAAIAVVWSIRGSAAYPGLLAIRDAEPFAASAGIRTQVTRVAMFSLSAAIAGLAGWTFSFLGFITPGQFNGTTSINILVMVILGGMNTRFGPIVGATFVSLFPVLVSWDPLLQEILFGAIFILVIVFLPEGFVGLVGRVARVLRRRPAAAPALVPIEEVARDLAPLADQPDPGGVALEALGVGFSYVKGTPVLSDVNFTVHHGTIHGLIGPNGSGKSTLVNLLSGALRPTSGTIALHGTRVERLGASRRPGLGLMRTFQTPTMSREVTTTANVTTGLLHRYRWVATRSLLWPFLASGRRISRELDSASVLSLQRVGLGREWVRAKVADVPHGVEQLTQLAAASVGEPSILILDEPLAGLSSGEVAHVGTILGRLKSSGVTVILVEHQTRFVFDVCDEVTVLAAGELVATGAAGDVRRDERVREVYLGQ